MPCTVYTDLYGWLPGQLLMAHSSPCQGSPAYEEEESAPPPGTPPVVPTFLIPPENIIITQPTPETEYPSQGTLSPRLHRRVHAVH